MSSTLPTGILTFLFTDIQGSTPLWEQDPAGMGEALALHNSALRGEIEAQGGQVFKIVGDEFQAVFVEPLQAVQAAVNGQRALSDISWGRIGPLVVRMGIHTGHAVWEGTDYAVAHTFNRTARIMSVGHGGQILLSQETESLVRKLLPGGVMLRDMGRHRLKGLSQQEHLFQIIVPDLPGEFPSLKTLDIKRHNLPAQVTPFIGREREIKEIQELISPQHHSSRDIRQLTLTGPGGIGKTRLAWQVGAKLLEAFRDGVFFVDLAAVKDPVLVLPVVERVLGIRGNRGQSSHETLVAHLNDKQLLLLLDNFEQVLPAANDVAALLSAVPGLRVLATSRSLLHIYGEVGYEVGSLQLPDLRQRQLPEQLAQYESIQLFSGHARAVKTGFTINGRNGAAVAEICRRLDGLPLAIELAAARIRLLTPQQMLKQLENRFRLLSGGARNLPPRQQTLQGAIDWSYDLLEAQEQALFKRLGVFAGGCSYESAESVCNFANDIDMFGGFEKLIDHSLLGQNDLDDEPRFVMLQTIRDYALKQLQRNGEFQEMRGQHLAFFTEYAETAQRFLESAEQNLWLDRLERDHDNFSVALRFAIDTNELQQGVRLAQALRIYWFSRGYLAEGRRLLEDLLSLSMEPATRALLLDSAGFLARFHGDYAAAEAYISEGLAVAHQHGDQHAIADSMANMGFVYLHQDQLDQAREVYTEALTIYHELGNEQGTADASVHLGLVAFYEHDMPLAQQYYMESLALWQRLGDRQGIVYAQHKLGDVAFQQADYKTAEDLYRQSLRGADEIGFQLAIATALEGLAGIGAVQKEPQRALMLAAAAAELREQANFPASAARRAVVDRCLAPAQEVLHEEEMQSMRRAGRTMLLDEALKLALNAPKYQVSEAGN